MSKLKTSATAKANFTRYKTEGRAAKNAKARAVRHSKKHPNDGGSRSTGGRNQDMDSRPSKLEAVVNRAVNHVRLFGQEVSKRVAGRDLSSSYARKALLATKAKTAAAPKAAPKAAVSA